MRESRAFGKLKLFQCSAITIIVLSEIAQYKLQEPEKSYIGRC